MSKIIFLDIDGVLCVKDCLRLPQINILDRAVNVFDHDCIMRLNRITDATNALIVISSAWRIDFWEPDEFKLLIEHFRKMGATGEIIGHTPYSNDRVRGHEIQEWLTDCDDDFYYDITSFIIIDDGSDMDHLTPRLVQTPFEIGLQDEHVDKAIQMLNEKELQCL